MNPREKRMVVVLGVLLALLAVWTVKNQYANKLDSLDERIAQLKKNKQDIAVEKMQLKRGKEAWAQAGRQVLAREEGQAGTDFRPDIDALVARVGLTKPSVTLQRTIPAGKNGLRSLPCTVTAEGQLDSVLKFLFELHQKPYLVRCRTISLSQVKGKHVPDNTLRLTAKLETLLLPDAREDGLPRAQVADVTSRPADLPAITEMASFGDYEEIIKRKIFEPWTPPIPAPQKVVGLNPSPNGQMPVSNQQLSWSKAAHAAKYEVFLGEANPPPSMASEVTSVNYRIPSPLTLGNTYYWKVDSINSEGVRTEGDVVQFTVYQPTTPVVERPPDPPKPPEDQNLVLARVLSSPRGQQAVLENPSNKSEEDKRVEVGEKLHGGTLIFVHPKGAVSQKDDKLWYHPLTKALRECVELTEQTQPELLYEVMKLEARAAGISQRPG